jgi:hypothetical protein
MVYLFCCPENKKNESLSICVYVPRTQVGMSLNQQQTLVCSSTQLTVKIKCKLFLLQQIFGYLETLLN